MVHDATSLRQGIGAPLPRKEDRKHLEGRAAFVGDIAMAGLLEVAFLRSPLAHARIRAIGVPTSLKGLAFIASDLDGVRPMRTPNSIETYRASDYPILAADKVRMVGEPIAMCVAASRAEAEDLCELIAVDFEELPAVADARAGLRDDAATIHDEVPGNLFMETFSNFDFEARAAGAAVRVSREFKFARQCAVPMEGRGALAYWDRSVDQLVLMSSTQVPHMIRTGVAECLGIPQSELRVIAPDVGGGFGLKSVMQPEEVAIAWLARKLRRPVRWTEDRREHLTGTANTRDHHYAMTAFADSQGHLMALDVTLTIDVGAYSVWPVSGGLEASLARTNIPGPYRLRGFRCITRSVATNKPPMTPFRGVARPGAAIAVDLMLESVAHAVGRDPVDVKRENLVPPEAMPYEAITGARYDSGNYPEAMRKAAAEIDLRSVRERQRRGEPDGRLIGVAVLCYVETTAPSSLPFARIGVPNVPGYEQASLRITPDGGLEIRVGTQSHGQGHETAFAQIAHEWLGIDVAKVKVVHGDTALTPFSTGIYASRGMIMAGGAVHCAAEVLASRLRRIAAHLLDHDLKDVRVQDGRFVADGGNSVTIADVAHTWYIAPDRLAEDVDPHGLEVTIGYKHTAAVGPISYGVHAAVVAVDVETGSVEFVDYVIVEDCGTVVNPLIVEGQNHGGAAQGIGTALYEETPYSAEGQPLTSTLADYVLPGAPELPAMRVFHLDTPSPHTWRGVKGMGEGATIGATGVVACAVNDALRLVGAEVRETPMTPRRIVQAVLAAQAAPAKDIAA